MTRSKIFFSLVGLGAFLSSGCTDRPDQPTTRPTSAPIVAEELFVDPEAEPDEGIPPLTVQFSANVEDNRGEVECEWDFGDGSAREAGLRPKHVFTAVADYEIVARCKDTTGLVGDGEVDVFVEEEENPPPRPTRAWPARPRLP